jgi:hypothetical protein
MVNKDSFNSPVGIAVAIIVALLAIGLIWGIYGAIQASKTEITCDTGLGGGDNKILCWQWHTNVAGTIKDAIDDYLEKNG